MFDRILEIWGLASLVPIFTIGNVGALISSNLLLSDSFVMKVHPHFKKIFSETKPSVIASTF